MDGEDERGATGQLQMDWDRYQRDGWIENALIGDGKSNKGETVSADKLKSMLLKLNSHMGGNAECFPSQSLLAAKMSVSVKTIERATEALQNKSLLIVQLKNRPGARRVVNHYRIIWSELLLLDPDRARAFRESVASSKPQSRADQSDMVTDQSDMVTDQSDMVTDQSDTMSDELLTNKPKNLSKNKPPRSPSVPTLDRRIAGASSVPAEWQVVVSVLKAFGMSACQAGVTAAIARELTPADAMDLVERWERLRARQPHVTVAWLYRWLTGDSSPPVDDAREQVSKPHRTSTTSETTTIENCRNRAIKAFRREGLNRTQAEAFALRFANRRRPAARRDQLGW